MLYICATPIGNLKDLTLRAIEVLSQSDIILCEDTRLSKNLLHRHDIKYKKLVSLHEHNESEVSQNVIAWLEDGLTITQISDAGTPGISDPGSRLCDKVLAHGLKVSPIPGACAYVSLLSVSGISKPSLFYGFLPSKKSMRCEAINKWCSSTEYALCIYESPHRIIECLDDIIECLGPDREIVLGRELTKQFETIKRSNVLDMRSFIVNDLNQQKGEFVLLIDSANKPQTNELSLSAEQIKILNLLLPELPPKKAVSLVHKITGADKDLLYNYTINLKK